MILIKLGDFSHFEDLLVRCLVLEDRVQKAEAKKGDFVIPCFLDEGNNHGPKEELYDTRVLLGYIGVKSVLKLLSLE